MKKSLFFTVFSVFILTSCQNEYLVQDTQKEKEVLINSHVEDSVFNNVNVQLANCFKKLQNNTRQKNSKQQQQTTNLELSEEQAKDILTPLVKSGQEIRDELIDLSATDFLELSQEEIQELNNMDEATLAEFAYFMYAITQKEYINNDEIYNDAMQLRYTKADLIDCLSYAIGFTAISGAYGYIDGTAGLITAKTAWQVGSKIIGRTLGWVGVAWAIYDYGDCLNSKRH